MGALHTEGFRGQTIYTPELVRDILVALRPDIILHEVPLRYCLPWGAPFPAPKSWGTDGWICNQAAQRLGIPLKPCDRPDRDEYRERTDYWIRYDRANAYIRDWFARMEKNESNSVEKGLYKVLRLIETPAGEASVPVRPEAANSEEFDQCCRAADTIMYDILPNYVFCHDPNAKQCVEDLRFLRQEWEDRNQITAQNILAWARKYPGGRVAVVIGNGHRYILRDLLKKDLDIELKEYYNLLDTR